MFIVGDLNCNMLKDNQDTKVLKDLCSSLNLRQLINAPTKVTSKSSTLIDLIITSNTIESGVLENHISDHFLIFAVLKLKLPKPQPKVVTARNYKRYDPEKFLQDLAQIPWCSNLLMDDVNEKVARFDTHFLNTLERHAPFKTMKIRYRQCPFLNDEIKELIKNRDNLHKIGRQTRMQSDWEKFHMCRESVKRKLRGAERKYVQNEIYISNKSRSMWKVIRDCVPHKETTELNHLRNVEELAEEFNVFFTSMGVRAAEAAAELAAEHYLPTLDPPALVDIYTRYHATRYKKSLCHFHLTRLSDFHLSVIKDALPCILPILTQIVNCSLLTSVFPTAWKKAEVIPLVKEGDHKIPNNNRPVSLLVAAPKICESTH